VFFLNFLFQEFFIMFKCCLNHLSLTEFIFAENVQMSSSCDHCACLLLLCVFVNSFKKYSECVYVKKLCSFSSQSFFFFKIYCFLKSMLILFFLCYLTISE